MIFGSVCSGIEAASVAWHPLGWKSAATPGEAETAQGFPVGYTGIKFNGKTASDRLRHQALGNSMTVNVMRWIGDRINQVDGIIKSK